MIYVLLILLIAVLIRHYLLKKEIQRLANHLQQHNRKIDLKLFDRDLERLGAEINHQIDMTKEAKASQRRTEAEFKQSITYISHDIRTPLTSIFGHLQLLQKDFKAENHFLDMALSSTTRLKNFLDEFFLLSTTMQADFPITFERLNIKHLLEEVMLSFYDEIDQLNLLTTFEIPEEEIIILADKSAMKRVLENLLSNAIKYSTGTLIISLHKSELTISNSTNITDISHLFDRFYKGDKSRTKKSTGLGLPIAKNLMEKMNGTLTAELDKEIIIMRCKFGG